MSGDDASLDLLAEDDRALYLVKPAGLPVFPPHADPSGDCVLRRLLALRPEQAERPFPPGFEGGIAHRLDNPTSGLLLVARSPDALALLRALFREKQLRKHYLFVTERQVPWRTHRVLTPLAHDARRGDRMIAQRGASTPHRGRWYEAETELAHQARTSLGDRWEAVITTGVMHQIRAHAAAVGLALRGDRIYGGGHPLSAAQLPALPAGAPFLLHHARLEGPGLPDVRCAAPAWWPAEMRALPALG